MMYSRSIIPKDFTPPQKLRTRYFMLRPLTINNVIKDFEAVMSSVDHLKGLMDQSGWPTELTIEENLIDLGWHQREFTLGHSFAYTVLSLDEKDCLGCSYIYPSENKKYEVEVFYWIRQNRLEDGLEDYLGKVLKQWLKTDWPFENVGFPGRN